MQATQTSELFLGSYRAVRLLGEGGMGQAFLGRHVETDQEVVIKVMRAHLADNARVRAAFQREMQVMLRFRHPYAVALLNGGFEGQDRPCLILEYVRGTTLEKLIQQNNRLAPPRACRLVGQLCQALHAAHGAGILHRDLSAENLMVVPGAAHDPTGRLGEHIKVMDFGLARLGKGFFVPMEKLTGSGTSIGGGTPDYMCPEQICGEAVDERGDLYSVGVILYKMLTGRLPFDSAEQTEDILAAHVHNDPPPFEQFAIDDVPNAVQDVVRSCLAKNPRARPQSARALAEALAKALGHSCVRPEDFPTIEALEHPKVPGGDPALDRFEAWMPEQIAVMKLRAFIDAVGGEVMASEPGALQVRLRDPRVAPVQAPRGLLSLFGLGRKTLRAPATLLLELLMERKQQGARGLVEITVLLPRDPHAPSEPGLQEQLMRRGFGERICRELRAYLMIGR